MTSKDRPIARTRLACSPSAMAGVRHRVARHLSAIALCTALAVTGSCGGAKDTTPTAPVVPARTATVLATANSAVLPLQTATVTFPTAAGSAGATLSGLFGTNTVTLAMADATNGTFLVPNLSAGTYTLTVDYGANARGTVAFTVQTVPAIADPKAFVTTAVAPVVSAGDELATKLGTAPAGALDITPGEVAALAASSADFKVKLAGATSADLADFARFVATNPNFLPAAMAAELVPASANLEAAPFDGTYQKAYVDAWLGRISANRVTMANAIPACASTLRAVSSFYTLLASACSYTFYVRALTQSYMLDGFASIPAVATDLIVNDTLPTAAPDDGAVTAATVSVEPAALTPVYPRSHFRTVGSTDATLLPALFTEVAANNSVIASAFATEAIAGLMPVVRVPASKDLGVFQLNGSDVTASVPTCTATPSGVTVQLLCSVAAPVDTTVNASFTFQGPYNSVNATVPVTVKKTWAIVGTPTYVITGKVPAGPTGTGCYITMTIPITGNAIVNFMQWSGVWTGGHSEGGVVTFAFDPRKHSGLQWVTNQSFTGGNVNPPFTVRYTIYYRVGAIAQATPTWYVNGSTTVDLVCTP